MRALAAMLVSVLASCTAEAGLVIDLRTDFVPGFDFVSAETMVSADGAVILTNSRAAFTVDDWLEGQRVAEVMTPASHI